MRAESAESEDIPLADRKLLILDANEASWPELKPPAGAVVVVEMDVVVVVCDDGAVVAVVSALVAGGAVVVVVLGSGSGTTVGFGGVRVVEVDEVVAIRAPRPGGSEEVVLRNTDGGLGSTIASALRTWEGCWVTAARAVTARTIDMPRRRRAFIYQWWFGGRMTVGRG